MTMTTDPFAGLTGTGMFGAAAPEFNEGGSVAQAPTPTGRVKPDDARVNKYPGKCLDCGELVLMGEGYIVKQDNKWHPVHNPGQCVKVTKQQTLPGTVDEPQGKIVDANTFDLWTGRYTLETDHGHRTFRVGVQESDADFAPGELLIEFLSGSDNNDDYTTFGFVKPGPRVVFWKRFRDNDTLKVETDTFLAVWKKHAALGLDADAFLASMEADNVYATRQCARCGEDLTVPQSVRQGMGPTCIEKGLR